MDINKRRSEILRVIKKSDKPVSAKVLAERFGVSRQVIVQDISVIRVSTPEIMSTNRGYLFKDANILNRNVSVREFKVCHKEDQVEEELNIIVDCGGVVKNISISHRVYGRITADMNIRSRQDVKEFLQRLSNSKSKNLGSSTFGYHYHLVEAPSEERLDIISERLEEAGLLVPLLPWEEEQKLDDRQLG